ncbi:hypothetical protein F5Y16DRAFT_376148 [Xylariaceae sp. FL0255]|nr:hypothetical protein F5Y16DRAFT_376148 [Xylariaceae sp. FL0255]
MSSQEQSFLVSTTILLNNTEGRFVFSSHIETGNCSFMRNTTNEDPILNYYLYYDQVAFTLQNRAQQLDLAAATDSDSCASIPGVVIDINGSTSYFPVSQPSFPGSCPILSNTTISPIPCLVQLNKSQASALSASATAMACHLWPRNYSGYNATCEPQSAGSLINTKAASNTVWGVVAMSLISTCLF